MNIRIVAIVNSIVLILAMLGISGSGAAAPPESKPTLKPSLQSPLFQPALEVDSKINTQLGKRIIKPAALTLAKIRKPRLKCNFSCSAYIPRQSILELVWDIPLSINKSAVSINRPGLRLDVTATSRGFLQENFSTIKFNQIPKKVLKQSSVNISKLSHSNQGLATSKQALFRNVRGGKITKRSVDLPMFRSINDLNQSIMKSSLPSKIQRAVLEDQMTGSLGQVRVMSLSSVIRKDKLQRNTVKMQGLQPALSYRFRVVETKSGSASTLDELVCYSPTCPADFIQTR
jgi:hypothetical protein